MEIPGESSSNNGAKFMKPIIPGFLDTFSIPVAFKEHIEMELDGDQPERVALVTEDKRHWPVKLEGGRRFGDGWKEFCEENELRVGDFLVFTHLFKLIFSVTVYNAITACARRFSHGKEKRENPKEEDDDATADVPSAEYKYPSYNVTMTSSGIKDGLLNLPKKLVESSGLLNRRCNVKLIDGKGKNWEVKLGYKGSNGQSYIIGKGWRAFQAAYALKPGNIIVIQFLQPGKIPVFKCFRNSPYS